MDSFALVQSSRFQYHKSVELAHYCTCFFRCEYPIRYFCLPSLVNEDAEVLEIFSRTVFSSTPPSFGRVLLWLSGTGTRFSVFCCTDFSFRPQSMHLKNLSRAWLEDHFCVESKQHKNHVQINRTFVQCIHRSWDSATRLTFS